MPGMVNPLAGFEDRIQGLVEGGLARLLAGRLHPREVAVQLARAMEDYAIHDGNGTGIAPDTFLVRLNPTDHRAILDASPNLTTVLAVEMVDLARRSQLVMKAPPTIKLLADAAIDMHHVAVAASHMAHEHESTEAMNTAVVWGVKEIAIPAAMLILQPDRVIPLNRPVVNIGRNRDNQIILDQPNVSRHHAQIRLRAGRYILFDLGSQMGTLVNGRSVREAILQPGDVIALAGTNLIYVEDGVPTPEAVDSDASDTTPLE